MHFFIKINISTSPPRGIGSPVAGLGSPDIVEAGVDSPVDAAVDAMANSVLAIRDDDDV